MTEREPTERPWSVETIAEFLNVAPERTEDIAFGGGVRFAAGDPDDPTTLELFSAASSARITTMDAQITLRRIEPPEVEGVQLVFERKSEGGKGLRTIVGASGEVTLIQNVHAWLPQSNVPETAKTPRAAERSAREATLERAVEMLVDALDRCAGDEPTCPHCGPARTFAAEVLERQPKQPQPEQERLTVTGRVGAELSFRTTRNGVLIARFPVAVHREDGGTTWETVVVFGKKAERLRGALRKGQAVEVVGYPHDREVPKRDGGVKTVHEIYGAVVRTR